MRDVQAYAWVHFYCAHLQLVRGDVGRAAGEADLALAKFDARFKDPYEKIQREAAQAVGDSLRP